MVLHHFHSETPSMPKVRFLKMDSPRRANWAEEELFKKSENSENGFPQRGNWAKEELFKKRSRSMNGVAVRDGELILWGMKAMP